jgi:hypothetical protein
VDLLVQVGQVVARKKKDLCGAAVRTNEERLLADSNEYRLRLQLGTLEERTVSRWVRPPQGKSGELAAPFAIVCGNVKRRVAVGGYSDATKAARREHPNYGRVSL